MKTYTKEQLEEALRAISSTVAKIEKIQGNDNLGRSQKTLIERRLEALQIASDLIREKMEELG